MNLSKNILITGIKGLIGKNTSKNLLHKGHKIIGIDISESHNDNKLDYYQCNLVSHIDTDKVLKKIFSKYKTIDCLIHLAGIDYKLEKANNQFFDKFLNISKPEIAMHSINSNIRIVYNIIYSLLPYFLKQSKSKIILAGSLYGSISPNPNLYLDKTGEPFYQKPIEYSISKSVFPIIAKYFCTHYASKGLVINNVEPHAIIDEPNKDFMRNFKNLSPMKRTCKVEEIVDFLSYLSLSDCDYLNGQTIKIDGGWSSF